MVENFRAGNLKQYGLDYETIRKINPKLIYCSITGFGQDGPYSKRGGYDYLVQAMGGIMSITGEEKGPPTKVGVGVSDIITGLYSTISILSALRYRDKKSVGQRIDVSLLDSQVSWLSYVAQGFLVSGKIPKKIGNDHPSIVPYQTIKAKDGLMVLAIANDNQFKNFCNFAGLEELYVDKKFCTNSQRVKNRKKLKDILESRISKNKIKYWVDGLVKVNVPCGPINNIKKVFDDPQVIFRKMKINMKYDKKNISFIGSPINLSESPVQYKKVPPKLGEDTNKILKQFLKLNNTEINKLKKDKII